MFLHVITYVHICVCVLCKLLAEVSYSLLQQKNEIQKTKYSLNLEDTEWNQV